MGPRKRRAFRVEAKRGIKNQNRTHSAGGSSTPDPLSGGRKLGLSWTRQEKKKKLRFVLVFRDRKREKQNFMPYGTEIEVGKDVRICL